eukprot:4854012-Pleurochrysis_carterae.AAC.1
MLFLDRNTDSRTGANKQELKMQEYKKGGSRGRKYAKPSQGLPQGEEHLQRGRWREERKGSWRTKCEAGRQIGDISGEGRTKR